MPAAPEQAIVTSATEEEVLFGRSRILKAFGAALFGFTAHSILKHEPAWAAHQPPPGPCYGYGRCHACSGSTCTLPECVYIHWEGCPTGASVGSPATATASGTAATGTTPAAACTASAAPVSRTAAADGRTVNTSLGVGLMAAAMLVAIAQQTLP
jgi:hypothetical protein